MNIRRNIDTRKRKTLVTLGGLGAGAALTSIPALTAAAAAIGGDAPVSLAQDLEITLISSPDVVENSLIIKNISKSAVTIDSFRASNIVFDGDVFDCNESCAKQALSLQPGQERVFWVNQLDSSNLNTSTIEYLDAQSATSYLPHGTRVVNLSAKVIGKSGHLNNHRISVSV